MSFRPLTGLGSFEPETRHIKWDFFEDEFPSPYGVRFFRTPAKAADIIRQLKNASVP